MAQACGDSRCPQVANQRKSWKEACWADFVCWPRAKLREWHLGQGPAHCTQAYFKHCKPPQDRVPGSEAAWWLQRPAR